LHVLLVECDGDVVIAVLSFLDILGEEAILVVYFDFNDIALYADSLALSVCHLLCLSNVIAEVFNSALIVQLILHEVHALLLRVELYQHKGEEGEWLQVFQSHHEHLFVLTHLMLVILEEEYRILLSLQHSQLLVKCDLVRTLGHSHLQSHVLGCLELRVEHSYYLDLLL
jgi:hypothetical protein